MVEKEVAVPGGRIDTNNTVGAFIMQRSDASGGGRYPKNNRGSLGATEISRYFFLRYILVFSLFSFLPPFVPCLDCLSVLLSQRSIVCHAYEWNDFATSRKNYSAVKRLPFIHSPARWTPDSDAVNQRHDNSSLLCASGKNGFHEHPLFSLEHPLEPRRVCYITVSKRE